MLITKTFIIFTVFYIILILACAMIAYNLEKKKRAKEGKEITVKEFLNNFVKLSPKVILVGLIFGIIFGMMDNISLYFGIEGFGKHLKEEYGMSDIEVAGVGNAYSGALGITLATFAVLISAYYFPDIDQNNLPVWLNTIGFLIGAILGIYIPKMLFGNKPIDE